MSILGPVPRVMLRHNPRCQHAPVHCLSCQLAHAARSTTPLHCTDKPTPIPHRPQTTPSFLSNQHPNADMREYARFQGTGGGGGRGGGGGGADRELDDLDDATDPLLGPGGGGGAGRRRADLEGFGGGASLLLGGGAGGGDDGEGYVPWRRAWRSIFKVGGWVGRGLGGSVAV